MTLRRLLAEFIKEKLEKAGTGISIESFYPIYFPGGKAPETEPEQPYRICVPGAVDFARRDYQSLLDELLTKEVPAGVKFVLLGRANSRRDRD